MGKSCGQSVQRMTALRIFAFKQRNGLIRHKRYHRRRRDIAQSQCGMKLVGIDSPVTAQLQLTAHCKQIRKRRMCVPASHQMAGPGPGIGVQQVMTIGVDGMPSQQAPDVFGFGPDQPGMCGQARRTRQARIRLIHAHHLGLRVHLGQPTGRMPGSATRIQN